MDNYLGNIESTDSDIDFNNSQKLDISLNPIKVGDLTQKLKKCGYTNITNGGNHITISNPEKNKKIPISRHLYGTIIPVLTLAKTIRQSGADIDSWSNLL